MDSTLSSLYEPLDSSRSEIRVLKVPPENGENFELIKVSLDEGLPFVALSYVWGDMNDRIRITVHDRAVSVTKNLKLALTRLRHQLARPAPDRPHQNFYVWADAICINQQDQAERGHQVQLMARIYTSADHVVSWLGPKDHSLAFQAIHALAYTMKRNNPKQVPPTQTTFRPEWLRHIPRLCRQDPDKTRTPFHNAAWEAISDLLSDQYWDRVWIFQEVALACRLRLLSMGDSILDWNDFELVWMTLTRWKQEIAEANTGKPDFLHDGIWSALTKQKIRWERIQNLTLARIEVAKTRASPAGHRTARWDLSTIAADLKATDHRDYIYGLLSVSGIPIVPDYRRTLSDLYTDYAYHWMGASRAGFAGLDLSSLGFLVVAGVGHFGYSSDFPTWAPNYPRNNQYQAPIARISIGAPQQDIFPNDPSKIPVLARETKSLWAWGLEIDSLFSVSPVLKEFDQRFFAFATNFMSRHRQYTEGIPPLQAILRLLTRDFDGPVTKSMILSGFGLLAILDELDIEKRYDFLRYAGFENRFAELLFPDTDLPKLGFEGNLLSTFSRQGSKIARLIAADIVWQWDTWGFIETTGGYLGIAPSASVPGDRLCVLQGSNFPVVLRKAKDAHFIVVGTAQVLGLMNGESASLVSLGRYSPQRFELR
ncbi:heterokaryon incompatibility protein-domain-containing protein [Fusarium solani]|uniref:Heterokaryon incompatibility protein-domain-containing protein n=1 Tax=Fusarium solani TaxID=169388 RepID=A0A9P9G5S4_FUSSL|nr:heterokaryon incompatibility protein-domain-containing protein [Fusarium solani]KAH7232718.1 heterokaryon incompatibility protein-domain-containing protein [Fusarium solani]